MNIVLSLILSEIKQCSGPFQLVEGKKFAVLFELVFVVDRNFIFNEDNAVGRTKNA